MRTGRNAPPEVVPAGHLSAAPVPVDDVPVDDVPMGGGAVDGGAVDGAPSGVALADQEFVAFVEATAPRLRRTAYLMCRDWHRAEDLTQIVFAKLYASWGRVRRTANPAAYSRRVLMNAIFDQAKRRSGAEVVLAELPDRPVPSETGGAELHVVLLRALATLSVRDQAIVVLRHWEDQSVDTVAEILGMSTSAVKMANARALGRLRELLGEDFVAG